MSKPVKDAKGTQRDHLERLAERGNARAIAELAGPEFPEGLEYLWRWYLELASGRRYGMNGAEPLSYTDVDAWARLSGREPTAKEVTALFALDAATLHPGDPEKAE